MAELSFTYRLIRKLGINIPEEEYGQISFFGSIKRTLMTTWHGILLKYCMYSAILAPLNYRKIRPYLWRKLGAKVGKDCYIGTEVYIDINHADLISIADNVHIDNRCFLLCHKRDISNYCVGDDYSKLGYKYAPIIIHQGCSIDSGSMVMPGVTIGEGVVIGAGSLVTKDIPAWSVAVGRPAKVVRTFEKRLQ